MDSRRSENARKAAAPLSSYEFDFGLGAGFSSKSSFSVGSLHAQKQQQPQSQHQRSASSWSATPKQPSSSSSWTFQSSSLNAPTPSMVGDISGKSWGAFDPMKRATSSSKNDKSILASGLTRRSAPDLFSDLLSGSLGSSSTTPLNKKDSQHSSSTISMETMMASLPKGVAMKDVTKANAARSTADDIWHFMSPSASIRSDASSIGMDSSSHSQHAWSAFEGIASGMDPVSEPVGSDDPFIKFFGVNTNSATPFPAQDLFSSCNDISGDLYSGFSKSNSDGAKSSSINCGKKAASNTLDADPFAFLNGYKSGISSNTVTAVSTDPVASVSKTSVNVASTADPLGSFMNPSASTKFEDPLVDKLWSSTKPDFSQNFQSLEDDWGMGAEFEGHETGTTTELEGLPSPPPGVTASLAKEKGLENYRQGQFADAIKWLSWAENLLESTGTNSTLVEVLTCRASCLKEAGEYKKAILDCTKVIELDESNTAVLLQRALLYECMEKYKLGIADLREVLKKEPQNRVASNTLSRLIKLKE